MSKEVTNGFNPCLREFIQELHKNPELSSVKPIIRLFGKRQILQSYKNGYAHYVPQTRWVRADFAYIPIDPAQRTAEAEATMELALEVIKVYEEEGLSAVDAEDVEGKMLGLYPKAQNP